jgi:cobalt/nickel transport system permease protein
MHIPDGYLSPSTCAAAYAAVGPFWYTALRKMTKVLHTSMIPLLAVFAAFSFVIMMFNLPLPGGTTGHAVGVGISAVVLGPWASILSISIAIIIQALLFGDGGILAIGANCLNMAVAGSLFASFLYRLISSGASLTSSRRVLAAGIAGYGAINLAALLAAIEFGIQPMLFRDSSGAPLYAPYPLAIAVPAMMIGHLTFAGLAEMVVAGGVTAYLQRTDPQLLRRTAGTASAEVAGVSGANTWTLWIGLAILMILTPLGLRSAGKAWGEWSVPDFSSIERRQEIATASRGVVPPQQAPSGLRRFAEFWTAPIPDYAPPFLKSAWIGYLLSAMVGVGLVVLASTAVSWMASRGR